MTAIIETGEVGQSEKSYQVVGVLVPAEASSASGTMTIYHRYSTFMNPVPSSALPIRPDGWVDTRLTDRRFSVRMDLSNVNKIGNQILLYVELAGRR